MGLCDRTIASAMCTVTMTELQKSLKWDSVTKLLPAQCALSPPVHDILLHTYTHPCILPPPMLSTLSCAHTPFCTQIHCSLTTSSATHRTAASKCHVISTGSSNSARHVQKGVWACGRVFELQQTYLVQQGVCKGVCACVSVHVYACPFTSSNSSSSARCVLWQGLPLGLLRCG